MLPVEQLSRVQGNVDHSRLIKPWWDVLVDYMGWFLIFLSVVTGTLQIVLDRAVCLPAVDCYTENEGNGSVGNSSHNACLALEDQLNDSSAKTVILSLDIAQNYKYVDTVCGAEAFHWFASYLSLILFSQASILLVMNSFWLRLPKTAARVETFLITVMACYNEKGAVSSLISSGTSSVTTETLTKIEKLRDQMIGEVFYNIGCLNAGYVQVTYFLQWFLQVVVSAGSFGINLQHRYTFSSSIRCEIDVIFQGEYEFYICSSGLAPFLRVIIAIFCAALICYCVVSFGALIWTASRGKYTFLKGKTSIPKSDLALLLHLLSQNNWIYHRSLYKAVQDRVDNSPEGDNEVSVMQIFLAELS